MEFLNKLFDNTMKIVNWTFVIYMIVHTIIIGYLLYKTSNIKPTLEEKEHYKMRKEYLKKQRDDVFTK